MVNSKQDSNKSITADTSERVASNQYDSHIIPAETAARQEREGATFKTTPTEQRQQDAPTDHQTDDESIHTTDGYTVDREGLLNNFAIEPEMYYEVPGDARQAEAEAQAERAQELQEINQDSEGKLTADHDDRGRGPGLV